MNDYNENIDNLNGLIYANNAGTHNSIYRGKYLGSSVTEAQKTAISTGTFDDLYIGDYWAIDGVNYRIAAFNYYLRTGDSDLTTNHVTIVPDTKLYTYVMNDTATTDGGYIGSKMYTTGLTAAKNTINAAFPSLVLTHRCYFSNTVVGNVATNAVCVDSAVELMSEVMVSGCVLNGKATYSSYNIGTGTTQLPLFTLRPNTINIRAHYWLRDVTSASSFADINNIGLAHILTATYSGGVRPVFSIKGS